MRLLTTISFLSVLFYLPLYAEEVPLTHQEPMPIIKGETLPIQESETVLISIPTQTAKPTLQELITEVKNAPNAQKRVLMNQLKIQLKSMNQESRRKAIKELKKSFVKKETHPKRQQHKNSETAQHGTHQPKFRHLQQRMNNNSIPHQPNQGGGAGHQGNGQK